MCESILFFMEMNDTAPSNALCAVSPWPFTQPMKFKGCNRELHTAFPAGNTDKIPSILLFEQQKWLLMMSFIPLLYFSHLNSWKAAPVFVVLKGKYMRNTECHVFYQKKKNQQLVR